MIISALYDRLTCVRVILEVTVNPTGAFIKRLLSDNGITCSVSGKKCNENELKF